MRTIRMLLLSLLAGVPAGAEEFIKLKLSPEWSFYSAPVETFDEAEPAKLTSAPETFGAAKRETVTFRDGRFRRTGRPGKVPAVVVNEFTSDTAGWMLLHCGAAFYRMKVALNGKELLHDRTSNSRSRFGIPGTHDVPLPVKKGRNVLAIAFLGPELAVGEGDPAIWRATLPTRENFARIRYAEPGTYDREVEETIIRNGVDRIPAPEFGKFRKQAEMNAARREKWYRQYPVLELYDRAIDKLLREIPATKVERGIVVWHLYNMGHVIKTPECCFGIDIYHRQAVKLVPLLDFALVSHNHGDHYDPVFCDAMTAAGKPVIANFLPKGAEKNPPAGRKIKDVTLEFEKADHNESLPDFIMCSRITCGRGPHAPVIYQTGDSCNAKQLHPSGPIDIHILHPRVGLSVPEAAELLHPREIWFSHLHEMGHCIPSPWRPVDFVEVGWDKEQIEKRGDKVLCRYPIWGEKFVIDYDE